MEKKRTLLKKQQKEPDCNFHPCLKESLERPVNLTAMFFELWEEAGVRSIRTMILLGAAYKPFSMLHQFCQEKEPKFHKNFGEKLVERHQKLLNLKKGRNQIVQNSKRCKEIINIFQIILGFRW